MPSKTNTCWYKLSWRSFYALTVSVNKFSGSCNTIDNPFAWVCVSNKVKTMYVKVLNLMPEINETRFLVQHESCEFNCELNESVGSSM